ncbi:MAG: phosphoglycerate kinase [Planctomycetota bacterium]|nr:MAG: phosphoglycerate kinase [Planctomycetota bacterium]
MAKKTIDQADVAGKRVLMRVDFNVPLDGDKIADDRRLVQALPSIRSVIDRGGRLILMSHLGRPSGGGYQAEFSLRPVARHLGKLLERDVAFAEECVGPRADEAVAKVEPGGALLLENLRFHSAETLIDKAKRNPDKQPTPEQKAEIEGFARGLARHGDLYCNDAFGTCHRKHVSMYHVPMMLGAGRRVCGKLVQKELNFLGDALARPVRPFVAILGGAKVSDKIGVIESLLPKVDAILIGGAMTYTFLESKGMRVGGSLCERDKLDVARSLLEKGAGKIRLPIDSICAEQLEPGAVTKNISGEIPQGLAGYDIGPGTVQAFRDVIATAKTIIWNGPMGVFETPPFDAGTLAIARALADATESGAITIIGGGDSSAAVEAAGLADRMTHISTGGGASLEFLEGKPFATIEILDDA